MTLSKAYFFSSVIKLPLCDAVLPCDVDALGDDFTLELDFGFVDARDGHEDVVDGYDAHVVSKDLDSLILIHKLIICASSFSFF